jgi:repressor LexA
MHYLTERQREVLQFIEATVSDRGVAPTLREIALHFEFSSTASAQKHIALLEKKGYLRRDKHQKRGLSILMPTEIEDQPGIEIPLLGTVAAGYPIESIPDPEAVAVPSSMLGSGEHFALRVTGDSMIDEGILDGDLVVVQRRAQAMNGETVVALVSGEATLKRFFRHDKERVRLQPANPAMPPLIVSAADVRLQGVLVGLLRLY